MLLRFSIRWIGNSLGLWIASRLFDSIYIEEDIWIFILAGLILSLLNALVKPIVILMTLPAVVFSLGLFLIIINGFVVWLASVFMSSFEIENFGAAILAGIIIGLVNYAVTFVFDYKEQKLQ